MGYIKKSNLVANPEYQLRLRFYTKLILKSVRNSNYVFGVLLILYQINKYFILKSSPE